MYLVNERLLLDLSPATHTRCCLFKICLVGWRSRWIDNTALGMSVMKKYVVSCFVGKFVTAYKRVRSTWAKLFRAETLVLFLQSLVQWGPDLWLRLRGITAVQTSAQVYTGYGSMYSVYYICLMQHTHKADFGNQASVYILPKSWSMWKPHLA